MTDITWLHASGHAGSVNKAVIELALEHEPTVVDWTEMYWNTDELTKYGKGYWHIIGDPIRRDSRNRPVGHDVVISVNRDANLVHTESFFVSRQITSNIKYMPERHGKAVVFDYEGLRVLIVAWHPHANPFRRVGLVLPVFRKSMRRAENVQRRLTVIHKPDLILHGGDLQLGPGNKWVHPNQMARRLGMKFERHGIDWQMWRGKGFKLKHALTASPKKANPRMDHPWSVLTLTKEEV